MEPIKVGIVGYGFSTKCFHLPFILPNPELKVHAFLQRAEKPATPADVKGWGHCTVDFPQARHYRTKEEFLKDGEVELVVLCSHEHEEFVRGALESGKHVVVEKPFVTTSKAADELIKLAKEKGKVLTVFHNRRFDSDYRTLHHLLHANALGTIKEADIHFDFPSPSWIENWTKKEYSPGEGMAFGLGTHTVDQALALFGRPKSVTGFLRANRNGDGIDSDVDDTFTIILQYETGLLVTVKTAVVTHLRDQLKFFVRGTEGTYLKFGSCPQEARAIAAPGQPATDPNFGAEDPRIWGHLTTTTEFDPACQTLEPTTGLFEGRYPSLHGWYRGYYENVADAVRGRAEVAVKPETARDGLRVIELARESHEKGCTVEWS